MRNDTKEDNPFISILLKGNGETVNKDAIGARIEIINGKDSGKFKQIQTLRAGQGFLSQSTKWIQFALNETIKSIDIKISWPDGTVSKIKDVLPNKKYIIRQENPAAEEVKLESKKNNLVNSPALKNPPSQVARIPAITLFKSPTINLRKNGIANQKNNKKSHQLINLWATWCAPCLQEMAHFRDHKKTLIDNEVELIAVNVDELDTQNDNSKKPLDAVSYTHLTLPTSDLV